MDANKLKEIIEKHGKWLRDEPGGERANLANEDLRWADMRWADMRGANMSGADMSGANMRWADMRGANMSGADMREANMSGAKNVPFIPFNCPDTGAFIGWKKVNGLIVKLQIPEGAKRCSATSRKCRCDKALVLAIENADGTPADCDSTTNHNYCDTVYKVGEMVLPDSFDEDRWNECSHGIHFFINRQEAVDW